MKRKARDQSEMRNLKQNKDFISYAFRKALFPCMLSIISSNLNILADGIIIGQKAGVNGIAGINLCMPVFLFLCVIGSTISSGTAVSASAAMGRGERDKAQECYELAIGWSLVLSFLITVLGLIFLTPLCHLLCKNQQLYEIVRGYTMISIGGAFTKIMLYIPVWFLRLDGRNREGTEVMALMGIGNVILDLFFLFGLDMGVEGAAIASVIATFLAMLLGFFFLSDKKSSFTLGIRVVLRKKDGWMLVKNGIPSGLNNLMQTLRVLLINAILLPFGSSYVAVFAAVNCISEISLCVINGVPQAAFAMLGVFYGEHDRDSIRLLMKMQSRYGIMVSLLFGVLCTVSSGGIGNLYGLGGSLIFPLLSLCISVFPALLSGILSSYYNVTDHVRWSNVIIACRVLLIPIPLLYLLCQSSAKGWYWFMPLAEFATIGVWFVCFMLRKKLRHEKQDILMLPDDFDNDKILNFSVLGTAEDICKSCERVSEFCEELGMSQKKIMRISLSMEELMTMIVDANDAAASFDLRLFGRASEIGIRIRYNGIMYNPFTAEEGEESVEFMGVRMIRDMVKRIDFHRIFGMNMLVILI
ncbi:MAG: MATE family efflux transporter [Eubacteriales bacterium]|nr:MATE family efflux transporter [Eubacteriales bacterium]